MYLCTVGTRYERSCLIITAIKYSTVLYVLDHVAHHDDQLPLVSVPDATTATQFGDEPQRNRQTRRGTIRVTHVPKSGRNTECTDYCLFRLGMLQDPLARPEKLTFVSEPYILSCISYYYM